MTKIIKFTVDDIRFPTSKDLTGSDAIHTDPDYSATYVTVFTSSPNWVLPIKASPDIFNNILFLLIILLQE